MLTIPKILAGILALCILVFAAVAAWLWPRYPYLPPAEPAFEAERLLDRPLIHAGLDESLGADSQPGGYVSIGHPSLIRVPDWIEHPLGRYYLYFSHHKGDRIRLAYADRLTGPWRLHEPGPLTLAASGFPEVSVEAGDPGRALDDLRSSFSIHVVRDYILLNHRATVTDRAARRARGVAVAEIRAPHIASPEVIIDAGNRRLLMYYHGLEYGTRQLSRVAESSDGLDFRPLDGTIPSPYLRHFEYRGRHYLLGMPGVLFRGEDPAGPFVARDRLLFEPRMRHAGLWLDGSTLHVFWSRAGDAPEHILWSRVDLAAADWDDWVATEGVEILRPASPWEGSELPVLASLRGEVPFDANELRDPFVFADHDGRLYLLYVARGEKAIGLAGLERARR